MISIGIGLWGSGLTLAQRITAIFSTGTNGYIYDPSDMASLNQLSTGLTPVTAVTQPVGLVLDKHSSDGRGVVNLVLGSDILNTSWAISGGFAKLDNQAISPSGENNAVKLYKTAGNGYIYQAATAANPVFSIYAKAAEWGWIRWRENNITGAEANFDLVNGVVGNTANGVASIEYVGNGWYRCSQIMSGPAASYIVGVSTSTGLNTINGTSYDASVASGTSGIYVWGAQLELGTTATAYQVNTNSIGGPGNHALQSTAAARPTWTNRVNLLTYTEQFDNAVWSKYNATITANDTTAPDGTLTADRLTTTSSVTGTYISLYPFIAGTYSLTMYYKAGANSFPAMIIGSSLNPGVAAIFNLTDGTMSQSNAVGTGTILSTSIVSVGAGWYRCSMTFSGFSSVQHLKLEMAPAATGNTFDANGDIQNNISGQYYYAWGAQLELGTTATTYQRVTTATDFDTVGFPYYLSFLGTDDSLSSATGGGGTAGFFWCGAVLPTGGAGTFRILFNDIGTALGYAVQITDANVLSFVAGNGTAWTPRVSTATINVGTLYLLTCWDDGVNLNVQIGDAAAETVARPVVVAGTAGYTIGRNNTGAGSFFIGNLYASVYARNTGLTAAQRATAQAWVKQKAGIV